MAAPKGTNWAKLKRKYVTGNISQEQLCKEESISSRQIAEHARKEHWFEDRKEYRRKLSEKVSELSVAAAAKKQVEIETCIMDTTKTLVLKIQESANQLDPTDPTAYRALTIALRDIQDIRGAKSPLDREEQEARIAKLRHDIAKSNNASPTTIEIIGLPDEFKK